ncbi:MAG: DUF2304 domain-containing protein [Eubacteriales bacterium]
MLQITILVAGIIFVLGVFKLLISNKINTRISLPWIACSFLVIFLALMPKIIDIVARVIGINYPPTLLFLGSILVAFLLLIYQAIQISVLQDKVRELSQYLAIINSTGMYNIRPDKTLEGDSSTGNYKCTIISSACEKVRIPL